MLQTVEIKNFQSHKDSVLNFSAGVNVIKGNSDSGKSAVLRAIKWALYNKPNGDEFRSWWGGDTSVSLTFDDVTVERKKGKVNEYILNGESLKAFGANVPEEVVEALNIDDINFQSQAEPYFLLSDTPNQVAQKLNKVVNLDVIDTSIKKANSLKSSTEGDIKLLKQTVITYERDLQKYNGLDGIEIMVNEYEAACKHIDKCCKDSTVITEIDKSIKQYGSLISQIQLRLNLHTSIEELSSKYADTMGRLDKVNRDVKNLNNLLDNIDTSIVRCKNIDKRVRVNTSIVKELEKCIELKTMLRTKESYIANIKRLHNSILENERWTVTTTQQLKVEEEEYCRTMPDTCPLCGKPT